MKSHHDGKRSAADRDTQESSNRGLEPSGRPDGAVFSLPGGGEREDLVKTVSRMSVRVMYPHSALEDGEMWSPGNRADTQLIAKQ